MKRRIKLMADYGCWALWEADPVKADNIDPETLPLSKLLKMRLTRWSDVFTATLKPNGADSGFDSRAKAVEFDKEGVELWKLLQSELGPSYHVTYQPLLLHREFEPGNIPKIE